MIFSKSLLRKLAPKLKNCLSNLVTEHEDIELGRCVQNVTGVRCTMAWEAKELFFQNFETGINSKNILNPKESDLGEYS